MNLQDALADWESLGYVRQQEFGWMHPIVEAARKYANPDIEAATVYAVKLFMGDKAAQEPIPPHIRTGSERIVRIALGITGAPDEQ